MTISADVAERVVEDETRAFLAGMRGRASAAEGGEDAARQLDNAQAELDSAARVVLGAGIVGEPQRRSGSRLSGKRATRPRSV